MKVWQADMKVEPRNGADRHESLVCGGPWRPWSSLHRCPWSRWVVELALRWWYKWEEVMVGGRGSGDRSHCHITQHSIVLISLR
jgi:hypothetical protein